MGETSIPFLPQHQRTNYEYLRGNALARYAPILRPFDNTQMTPQDIGLGGPSTEYLATGQDFNGNALNYPLIWWNQRNEPVLLNDQNALALSYLWEGSRHVQSPRYPSIGVAEYYARNRSANGGAENGPLFVPVK